MWISQRSRISANLPASLSPLSFVKNCAIIGMYRFSSLSSSAEEKDHRVGGTMLNPNANHNAQVTHREIANRKILDFLAEEDRLK